MSIQRPPSMGAVEWLLVFALALLWGGSFFFGAVAVAELPPFTVVLGRVGIAALALHLVVLASGRRMPRAPRLWGAFFAMGALNNLIPFSLILWGQTQIPSGLASILNATTPLFTIVVAHFATRDERMTGSRLAGIGFGIAGVALMIGRDALGGLGEDVAGQLAVLGAALSYGCAGVFGRRFRGLPPVIPATGQVTATAVMMLPTALVADRPWTLAAPSLAGWGAVLGLALLCTAVAYLLYFRILARAGATNVSVVTFLVPVSAILLGALVLGERLELRPLAGMALIGVGLAAIDGRPLAFLRARLAASGA